MTIARRTLVLAVATAALLAAVVTSLALGAVKIPIAEVIEVLTARGESGPVKDIILTLRLPRAVEAIAVGASLGVAGSLLQGALANPLASPDVIGVTGGAGFGAILILLVFPGSVALLPLGALAFGLLAATLVFAVAWAGPGAGSIGRVVLSGIAIGAMFGAAMTGLMAAFPERVPSAIFFLAGGLTTTGWSTLASIWPYFAAGLVIAAGLVRPLDRLALGDDVAASLGTRPRVIRLGASAGAALLAAASAAVAGLLGFLGLFVPHLVRMASGTSSHSFVVPVSALTGAAILTAGDTLARIFRAPIELPVGPFMVLIGVPIFLWLLRGAVR